jgi:hypothetical protein
MDSPPDLDIGIWQKDHVFSANVSPEQTLQNATFMCLGQTPFFG